MISDNNNKREYTLRDICMEKGQYGIAESSIPYQANLPRYLRITDITDEGFLNPGGKVSVDVDSKQYEKYLLRENDIVFARTGASAGRNYVYEKKVEPLIVAGFLIRYRLNPDIVNPRFMRYFTISPRYKDWVKSIATGSTRPNINEKMFSSMKLCLPSLEEQQKSVQILDSMEKKLKNNNAIIANLEEQVHVIFKSWFVDFEPFQAGEFVESELGEIPSNWEAAVLEDYLEIKYGKDHKKLSDGCYPVYGSGGVMRYVEDYLYKNESVLVPRKGTLNNVMYVNEPFWSVDTMFYTIMKQRNIAKFIYLFLKRVDLKSMNVGSAVPSMTIQVLNNMKIIKPTENILTKFESIVGPMFEKITQLQLENKKLAEIRDTLLPKLMSGEIRVGDLTT